MDDEEILLPSQEIYESICDNCGQEYITTNERDTTCQDCRLKTSKKYSKIMKRRAYIKEWMRKYRLENKEHVKKIVHQRITKQKYRDWHKEYRKKPHVRFYEKEAKKNYRLRDDVKEREKEYMKYYNPQYRLRKKIMKLG